MRNRRRDTIKSVRRRLDVEQALRNYPNLPPDRIADLTKWFKREATAMEVAAIAGNPNIQSNYCRFRDQHLDRLTAWETALATGLGVVLIAVAALAVAAV
jgi:hypothetical protein